MDNHSICQINFASFNVFMVDLPNNILYNLNKKVEEIQDSWNGINWCKMSAGHIKKQYALGDVEGLDKFIIDLSTVYYNHLGFSGYIQQDTTSPPVFKSEMSWVNFQAPTEYNPLHSHSGLFSWVIWIKIPFDREEEKQWFPDMTGVLNGSFQFVYPSVNGVSVHRIDLDKSYEGKILIFPSTMKHEVYPFYTTNEYRISAAGNVFINNNVLESIDIIPSSIQY